ncbi:MAG TPA: hypothetical protein VFQ25_14550 [Ktedonobacterales bacterium]|nr:hypothetical protein [Ktedonobacterales bacterium]
MAVGWARTQRGRARLGWAGGVMASLALAMTLAGCSLGFGGDSSANGDQALSALPWCGQPQISFVDSGSSSQQTITQWDTVKGQLGFTPYLPSTLPKGSCLDLVGGAVHDPIFGGHLSVTWVLPGGTPISFSEAPKRGNTATTPQCTVSSQAPNATTVCIGAVDNTSVTVASHMSESQIKSYFSQLKAATDWAPAPAS